MNVNELINKLQNTLNRLIIKYDSSIKATELSNELLETIKIIENCTSCKDKEIDRNDLGKIENCLAELKKEQRRRKKDIINRLNYELRKIDFELNKKVLCKGCKGKKIKKLTDKYMNEEAARFFCYDCEYIRWFLFDEFKNIGYLAKGDFGEIH